MLELYSVFYGFTPHDTGTSAKLSPVFSCFVLKHAVTILNLLSGHGVDPHFGVLLCYSQESIVNVSLPILSHVPIGTPDHVGGVCRLLEVIELVFHQQGDAGVRHHADTGAASHVFLISHRGRIVHPEHTSNPVYIFSCIGSNHLTRAGDQGTLAAVETQELWGKKNL